jgi:hypothetical protein
VAAAMTASGGVSVSAARRVAQSVAGGGQRDGGVHRIDRAAGKDEFRGHEGRRFAALAHQNAPHAAILAQDDDGRGVANGGLVGQNPCIRLAHCTPTISPLNLGKR